MSAVKTRIVPTLYDDKGRPYCKSIMSRTENTVRAKCTIPPDHVIPVIFVPGIMGSNLKSTAKENIEGLAWAPDSFTWARKFMFYKPAKRQILLNPSLASIDDSSEIPNAEVSWFSDMGADVQANWKAEFKRRGWGTVMLSSYGPLLYHLEYHLNRMYQNGKVAEPWQALMKDQGKGWGELKGFAALIEKELLDASDHWFPVHAVGYNWLESNDQAGKYLAGKIEQFIAHYRKQGYPCDKAILVTHSMGGLVARAACHPKIGNAASKVLGVVHGVQPATGAATAYKRVHAGFEAGLGKDTLVAKVLGWTGADVTAVFANAPGALQLLPNKLYPAGWLKVSRTGTGTKAQDILSLPKADPYQEIYREKDKWWRLIQPEWIDPSGKLVNESKDPWERYLDNLDKAEQFHDTLGDYYHPSSWVHYGADEDHRAWGHVRWYPIGEIRYVRDGEIENARLKADNSLGRLVLESSEIRHNTLTPCWNQEMESPHSSGDGTVPEESGRAPQGKVKFIAKMRGFDHQGSYQYAQVQALTLYCIAKIAGGSA